MRSVQQLYLSEEAFPRRAPGLSPEGQGSWINARRSLRLRSSRDKCRHPISGQAGGIAIQPVRLGLHLLESGDRDADATFVFQCVSQVRIGRCIRDVEMQNGIRFWTFSLSLLQGT